MCVLRTTFGTVLCQQKPPNLFLAQTKMSWRSLLTVLEVTPWDQGSELSSATVIPQMTVIADLTRSEDWLSLKPGCAVGDCHARRLPSGHEAERLSLV